MIEGITLVLDVNDDAQGQHKVTFAVPLESGDTFILAVHQKWIEHLARLRAAVIADPPDPYHFG